MQIKVTQEHIDTSEMHRFIRDFDLGFAVSPFEFELDIPQELLT